MSEHGNDERRYEWQSNGGCTRCDGMDDRFFATSPARPHPNCNCSIYDRSKPSTRCDESDVRYSVTHAGNNHHGPFGPDDEFDIYFDYHITCWGNGGEISGQVSVSVTYGKLESTEDIQDLFDDAIAEALELVDDIAVNECPVCAGHPHVA